MFRIVAKSGENADDMVKVLTEVHIRPLSPEKLKQARIAAGFTLEQLAAKLDVYPSAVSRWEGGAQPLRKRRESIARALGVRVTELYEEEVAATANGD